MSGFSPLLSSLIDSLRCLPGVGQKSAQRMAFHLLERDRDGAKLLATQLIQASDKVGNCKKCRTLTELEVCSICSNNKRDQSTICIVENPTDVVAIEASASFSGLYFVLMGHLSPLDGVGPEELGLELLAEKISSSDVNELILATNPTVEGEATAHYISEMAAEYAIKVTRIAHGVPLGGELEYIDGGTLSHAFAGRTSF